MGQLGIGVMIGLMGGNAQSVQDFNNGVDKTITALSIDEDSGLHFTFEDGYKMRVYDGGQSCCEHRYMTTDDNLSAFVGSKLISAEVAEAPNIEDEYGEEHEVAFLKVTTSLGVFTCETHNEHNGYYGGFLIQASAE